MFVAGTPYIEPLMFHLAAQQNTSTLSVSGAEKTRFAWQVYMESAQFCACSTKLASKYFKRCHRVSLRIHTLHLSAQWHALAGIFLMSGAACIISMLMPDLLSTAAARMCCC